MQNNSWIIVNKATGNAIQETFNKHYADAISLSDRYVVMTAYEYLCGFNKKLKEMQTA